MSSKSNWLENWVLDRLGDSAFASTIYVALYTAAPSDIGGGTEVPNGLGGYARIPVANNIVNWPPAVSASKHNGVDLSFTSAGADIGTIVAMALFDAALAGNMLWWSAVVPTITMQDGDTITFPAGTGIVITEE
jgi:hypothetical protein